MTSENEPQQDPFEKGVPASNPYQIYCDMDGVLVNFAAGATETINSAMKKVKSRMHYYESLTPDNRNPEYRLFALARKLARRGHGWNDPYTWEEIDRDSPYHLKDAATLMFFLISNNSSWWENLGWTEDGKQLWSYIEKYNPIILSSGVDAASAEGKKAWCAKELGLPAERVIVVPNKGIKTGNKIGILIDDRTKPLSQFHGMKILHRSAEKSIKELENLGL